MANDMQPSIRDRAMTRVFQLRAIDLFAELSAEALLPVATIARPTCYQQDEIVFTEGSAGEHLYVITDGQVEVTRGGERLALLSAGECFGEMAMLDQTTRSATVRAVVTTQVLAASREDFYDLLDLYPELAHGIARVLVARLREANKRT